MIRYSSLKTEDNGFVVKIFGSPTVVIDIPPEFVDEGLVDMVVFALKERDMEYFADLLAYMGYPNPDLLVSTILSAR
jgi:uncharacterized protein YneR